MPPQEDYFYITRKLGIAGPEVMSKGEIPPGTELVLQRVIRCMNCWPRRLEYEVKLRGWGGEGGLKAFLEDLSITTDGRKVMDPHFLQTMDP